MQFTSQRRKCTETLSRLKTVTSWDQRRY